MATKGKNGKTKDKKDIKNYICCSVNSKHAYFSRTKSKTNVCYTKETLVSAIEYIIDNSYITFQDIIYRQIVGIPMGTNCAPYLANIYLHVFEYNYLSLLVSKGQIDIANKLCNIYRFQDDCISINDSNVFKDHYIHMYPPEMILKPTNISRDKCTFLDLTISIYRGKFMYYSYDKRRDFDFNVVSYPNLCGNIPTAQSYGVFTSQLVRFCDINQHSKHFKIDVGDMSHKFLAQGFNIDSLRSKYRDFCSRYMYKWAKFNDNIAHGTVIDKIFPSSRRSHTRHITLNM